MERKNGMAKQLMAWLYLKAPVYKTKFVTAVSETTKKDIINYTGVSAEKICVIQDNVDSIFKPIQKIFNYTCPVILQIGTAPNKNLSRLTDAVKSISCKLVIIGSPGEREIEKLAENKIAYVIKSNLSADELYQEYVNADIVAFVSTFEGFGMPIVEANCVERAVLTSNISSMPEVAGDAACLVDPYDIEDIRKGLLKLIHNKEYRGQIIANGRKNKLRFDGQIIAEQYYELYKKIAENF
jgi:glycosyltransferase involved in cell wall biosynthesis